MDVQANRTDVGGDEWGKKKGPQEEDVVLAARGKHSPRGNYERGENELTRGRQIASGHGVLYLASEKHGIHHLLFWLTRYKKLLRSIFFQNF